ncbi:MAG: hypothetical protein HW396_1601 [Candidatus Dadabacteria bacterium]|nr:hypothetical protein [Candidatus Dadabacteria bacterium]
MRINNLLLSERKKLALNLKEALERDGFNTFWSDETTIQVEDLPIPKIVPFDIANLIISVQEYHIYFAIIIKFIKVLEDLIEAEEINKVCDLHNDKWLIELTNYFSSIDPSAKLKWDVEYDVDIEDTMCGFFDTVEEVIPFISSLRRIIVHN